MYAVFYFIEKFHSYLTGREFTLRVDKQALSRLKTYSMDQAMIGRWIAPLDQYHFKTIHRPRTQNRNADGLSKWTNDYIHRERIVDTLPEVSEGFNFMSKEDYEDIPTVPYFDKRGHLIPDHPELPPEAPTERAEAQACRGTSEWNPWYLRLNGKTTPTIDEDQRPNHILSITTNVPPARLDTAEHDPAQDGKPVVC